MSEPVKIEWNAGKDIHGRRVTLTRERTYTGATEFVLRSHAVSQRDEDQTIRGLSVAVLKELGRIGSEQR